MTGPKVGVYICHCGGNISDVIDVEEVTAYARSLEGVAVARNYIFMCSNPGQELIEEDIREERIDRVVVASCSPRLHEPTFRKALARGGLNPYLFEMANIREQCSWAHAGDGRRATEKAKDLIRMAVAKAVPLEPLAKIRVESRRRVLVVGGGVAGLRAGLDLAGRGLTVHLVEKTPFFGGRMAQLDKVYPTEEEATALLRSLLEQVAGHPRIKMYPSTVLEAVDGFVGNWHVTLRREPRFVSQECDLCGRCAAVCPVETADSFNEGLARRKAIYFPYPGAHPPRYAIDAAACTRCGRCAAACPTGAINPAAEERVVTLTVGAIVVTAGFDPYEPREGEFGFGVCENVLTLPQLTRLLAANGPTGGELRLPGRERKDLKNIVFIGCVGSRQVPGEGERANQYCSRYCCTAALQAAQEMKRRCPGARISFFYRDIRTYGRDCEDYYEGASRDGVLFIRYKLREPPVVTSEDGRLRVTARDLLTFGETVSVPADLVVLVTGMELSRGAKEVAEKLRLPTGNDGFLLEVHPKLRPVEVGIEGLFIAGTAQGPKDITETVLSASAAAARASVLLGRGYVKLEPFVAKVRADRCDGCGLCLPECDFGALAVVEGLARVNEALCKGCGACAAVCPHRALGVRGYTVEQMAAMVDAAVAEGVR
ncbi:MAG: CoB--CoM heterodisulfide reductase iron-sulfur subunit A family protein [Bacillota bacterium]|nr:CoB--CoM heterodisulfide reductase iron-sulfur subunit A family protein [Bacillota bacterium]